VVFVVLGTTAAGAQEPAASAPSAGAQAVDPDAPHAAPPEQTAPAPDAARAAAATQAYPPEVEEQTRRLAAELRCPVCQGLSIEDSPTELSHQMKDVIRRQLAAGKTPEEVKAYFVARYGEWILLKPKAAGFNLLIYLLPLLAVLAGAAVIALAVRRWTRAPSPAPAGDAAAAEAAAEDAEADDPVLSA
jgi:cytochrome c-type biogenesis protein CcmH